MNIAKPFLTALALASLSLAGCYSAPAGSEERIGSAEQEQITLNHITLNHITLNHITLNHITLNHITLNDLTLASLEQNLQDPGTRDVVGVVVSCALPASQTLSVVAGGVDYTFPGELGLAPAWGQPGGECDAMCQEWVSACVLARVDYLGVERSISVRGDKAGLQTSAAERAQYPDREAAYYGNIFSWPQKFYACLSPGQTEDPRVCGPSIETCGIDVVGSCGDVCDAPAADGSFPNCRVPNGNEGCGGGGGDVYHGTITVYLQPGEL